MTFYADNQRHLICTPYTVERLHAMAEELDIARCWYHSHSRHPHYDIPKRRIKEILAHPLVVIISSRELLRIILLK